MSWPYLLPRSWHLAPTTLLFSQWVLNYEFTLQVSSPVSAALSTSSDFDRSTDQSGEVAKADGLNVTRQHQVVFKFGSSCAFRQTSSFLKSLTSHDDWLNAVCRRRSYAIIS